MMRPDMSVHLLTGDDESMLRAAVSELVHELVADGDRSLMVDEFDGDDVEVRSFVDSAQTPPFLTDRRVVVARDVGRFNAEALAPLVAYLGDPLPTTELVLVGGGGRLPKSLTDAVKKAGGTARSTDAPQRARDRQGWIVDHAAAAGVRLAPPAAALVAERLGEDVGRLDGVLATLAATFGATRQLRPEDVAPFIGEAGGVPPWDLTDAVDAGETGKALAVLGRMSGPGGRHPLQLMAILHGHYARLARLDGVPVSSEAQAAEVLGIKPGFPAKKALTQYRRLGGDGVRRAIELLAAADLDLRGRRDLGDDVVMEILVARLSRLRR
jgi:DNA polymerase-3 subunit delta